MSNTFCPLLFQHLATHPYGGVTHCCISDHRNQASNAYNYDATTDHRTVLNVNNDSLLDIYNSDSFKTARLQSLNGEIPPACSRCFTEEKAGLRSKRLEEIENYPNFDIVQAQAITDDLGIIADPQFEFVELRLGNTCNVACRTCNPASSSKWKRDYDQLEKRVNFDVTKYTGLTGFRWPEREKFWDQLFDRCHNVKTFYINGGEPMLIKQHFKFLRRLVEAGRTDIKLWYNINMTTMNEEALELWANFEKVHVSMSIDDLGERNEYIRHPTDWETVLRNVTILQENDWIDIDITQTVSFMNYPNIVEFYEFFTVEMDIPIHHNVVYDPSYLSPRVLPRTLVERTWTKLEGCTTLRPNNMLKLKEAPGVEQDITGWKRAMNYTKQLDRIRDQHITFSLPEFTGYFKS